MELAQRILVVIRFECRRGMILSRVATALVLAVFPLALVLLVRTQGGDLETGPRGPGILFALLPGLTCLMCLLLWAIPAIHSEVEGSTWPYLAVRPGGKSAVLLGKYLTAVAWTTAVGWLGVSLCAMTMRLSDRLETWCVLGILILLSALAYGALFVLLGVVFLRRAMVLAVGYAFIMEFLTGFIPAVIHRFTIQYHLRSLLSQWTGWTPASLGGAFHQLSLFSPWPAWGHLLALLGGTAALLAAAGCILRQRELIKPESE
ncbi:MAG TPA: hypothetical protein EYH34_02495 [Planctomycetes bacterium]|nr:hypothetical protein [Planctomycetota bacterium]